MKCWNCQNALDEVIVCGRCGMPQMVGSFNPFGILNIPPRLHWDEGEVRTAYERLALRCHPDLFRAHRDERVLSAASSAMRAINDAFREIREPVRRLRYVLAAVGQTQGATRTVPAGLQDSVQIIERVLTTVDEARKAGDRVAWEGEQDHLASLLVKIEKARERTAETMRALVSEWDGGVESANNDWPDMSEDWMNRAMTWAGEREYLDSMINRVEEARRPPEESE